MICNLYIDIFKNFKNYFEKSSILPDLLFLIGTIAGITIVIFVFRKLFSIISLEINKNWDKWFREHDKELPNDTISRLKKLSWKIWRIVLLIIHSLFRKDIFTKASILSFYTITSLIPACAFLVMFQPDFFYSEVVNQFEIAVFPKELVNTLNTIIINPAEINKQTENSSDFFLILGSIIASLWGYYKLFHSVEQMFNHIWQVEDRSGKAFFFYFLNILLVIIGITVILFPILNLLSNIFCWKSICIFCFFCLSFATFYFVPNKKNIQPNSILWGTIIFCIGWIIIYYVIHNFYSILIDDKTKNYGVIGGCLIFLIMIIDWVWIACLLGVNVSALCDDQSEFYMAKECRDIAPFYKRYLTILVAIIIFKKWHNNKKYISNDEIRNELNIPNSLLAEITKELEKRKIICQYGRKTKYNTNYWQVYQNNYINYTLSDLIYNLRFVGNYNMKYEYDKFIVLPKNQEHTNDNLVWSMMLNCEIESCKKYNDYRLIDIELNEKIGSVLQFNIDPLKEKVKKEYKKIIPNLVESSENDVYSEKPDNRNFIEKHFKKSFPFIIIK